MGRKPKAGGAEGEAKANRPRVSDPEQSARFLEAARQAGVDETGEAFERAFEKIARAKRAPPEAAGTERSAPKRRPRG
jgi:hypothetical protein